MGRAAQALRGRPRQWLVDILEVAVFAAVIRHDELPLIRVGERHGKHSRLRRVCSDDLVDDTLEFRGRAAANTG